MNHHTKRFILLTQAHTKITSSDLQSQGRLDIVLHSIITALFASHTFREDTQLEIILMGPPLNPRKIRMQFAQEHTLSKKNLKRAIEIALKKCKSTDELEVLPGVFVCEIDPQEYIQNTLEDETKYCAILDSYGKYFESFNEEISKIIKQKHSKYNEIVYFLGDHEGIDKKTKKLLKKQAHRISLGNQMYFTSQVCTILHYEMDKLNEQ